jgi:hypothetical protein
MVTLRPRMRIAWWAAVLATAAAYAFRALFVLGGDFRPQMPADALIGGALVVLLVGRAFVARWTAHRDDDQDDDRDEGPGTHTGAGNDGRPGAGPSMR